MNNAPKPGNFTIARKLYLIMAIGIVNLLFVSCLSYYLLRTLDTVTLLLMCESRYAIEASNARFHFERYTATREGADKDAFAKSIDISIAYADFFGHIDVLLKEKSKSGLIEDAFKIYEEIDSMDKSYLMIDRSKLLLFFGFSLIEDLIEQPKKGYGFGVEIKSLVEKYGEATEEDKSRVYSEIHSKFDEMQKHGKKFSDLLKDLDDWINTFAVFITFSFSMFTIIILMVSFFIVQRSIVGSVVSVTDRIRDIAEGEGDLTARVDIKTGDEMGELASCFNLFIDKLQKIIFQMAANVDDLHILSNKFSTISDDMTDKSTQMKDQSNEAASATEETSGRLKNMAASAEEVSSQALSVAASSEDVAGNMREIDGAAVNVSDAVNNVASAIEEMYASLNEVAKNSGRGANVTGDASDKAQNSSEIVNRLGEAAKEIGDVVDLIKGIAAQTNLLALNATIEAAGAGEAGKGFAVVANEVKELARQTGMATETIRGKVEGMQQNTNSAVGAIELIVSVIDEINSIMSTIATAVEEQTATMNGISKSISSTAVAADMVSKNVQETVKLNSEVSISIDDVAKAAVEIAKDVSEASIETDSVAGNVSGLDKSVEATSRRAEQTNVQAGDLAKLAAQLQTIVKQFKI